MERGTSLKIHRHTHLPGPHIDCQHNFSGEESTAAALLSKDTEESYSVPATAGTLLSLLHRKHTHL